jgi:GGDEF domain-containing protein
MDLRDSAPPGQRLARAARAAQDLCNALWGSMHDELGGARIDPQRVAELSRRLADICSTIALLAAGGPEASGPQPRESTAFESTRPESAPIESFRPPPEPAQSTFSSPAPSEPARPPFTSPAPSESAPPPFTLPTPYEAARPPLSSFEPPEPNPEAGIEIHDARREEGPTAWVGSIGRRLERYRDDRLPFAVLLIEVLGIDQLAHAEPAQELARLVASVERALGGELRPADLLTQETRGRYWLVTPETDAPGARTLAERLARTVRASALHRGVGLEVAIGIAICPDDGLDASALAAHADVGVYAARACGRSVAPVDDPAA